MPPSSSSSTTTENVSTSSTHKRKNRDGDSFDELMVSVSISKTWLCACNDVVVHAQEKKSSGHAEQKSVKEAEDDHASPNAKRHKSVVNASGPSSTLSTWLSSLGCSAETQEALAGFTVQELSELSAEDCIELCPDEPSLFDKLASSRTTHTKANGLNHASSSSSSSLTQSVKQVKSEQTVKREIMKMDTEEGEVLD